MTEVNRWMRHRPATRARRLCLTIAGLVREVIVAAGEFTADELDSWTATLRAHPQMPGTVTLQPLMSQAWGRVPEPG